jgi:hypothetical protein
LEYRIRSEFAIKGNMQIKSISFKLSITLTTARVKPTENDPTFPTNALPVELI